MELTPGGGVKVSFNKNDSFSDLLDKAIQADREAGKGTVEDLLRGQGYYSLNSMHWVGDIRNLELGDDVRRGARQLLYDLAGPFTPAKEALAGADRRLLEAITELKIAARRIDPESNIEANAFLAAIWENNLEQSGVFEPRSFNGNVTLIAGADPKDTERHVIYACPGSPFAGKEVTVLNKRDDFPWSNIRAIVRVDLARFGSCVSTRNLKQLLANQKARMGMSRDGFGALYGKVEENGTLPPRLDVKLYVLPVNLTASVRRGG